MEDDILARLEKKIELTKGIRDDSFNALEVQFQYLDVDGVELPEKIQVSQENAAVA